MKIVVLNGSPRKNGNTACLVDAFVSGVNKEYDLKVVQVADLNISPCRGCNLCANDGKCVQNDQMREVYETLSDAEVIVVATPLYFYGISAQLKCLIDRLHNPVRDSFKVKKLVLLSCGGSSKTHIFEPLKMQYKVVCDYFGLESAGIVTAYGARGEGTVDKTYLLEARKIGENL